MSDIPTQKEIDNQRTAIYQFVCTLNTLRITTWYQSDRIYEKWLHSAPKLYKSYIPIRLYDGGKRP